MEPSDKVTQRSDYDYVAYIDESGDPGLSKVKPLDLNGSSEWLIVSAVIVRKQNEGSTDEWVRSIAGQVRRFQARAIHFTKLNPTNKAMACTELAAKPARIFIVASNKKNMKGYTNPFAELQSLDRNWFYCWLTRVLLERVTHYVAHRCLREYGEFRNLKLIYSTRGGLSYSQLKAYFELLRVQSRGGSLFLQSGDIYWGVLNRQLVEIIPHYERGGLQLADIAASAFFKACDCFDTGSCDSSFAKLLHPVVGGTEYQGPHDGEPYFTRAGYGLKLLPSFRGAKLLPSQEEIFRFYGYPRQWWDPTPSTPQPYSPASWC